MKLNYNAAKDIMLFLEEFLVFDRNKIDEAHDIEFTEYQISKYFLEKYSEEDIGYAIVKLEEAGYICTVSPGWVIVQKITYKGHEFLGNL